MRKFFFSILFLLASGLLAPAQEVKDSLATSIGVYTSPEWLINGKVSGVRVFSTDGNIAGQVITNIRGLNSIFATSNPLWVVDGVILSDCSSQIQDAFDESVYGRFNYLGKTSQLDFINLYDIESIEVLKNVCETARYGAKGANGVIRITTRGAVSEKPHVVLHSNLGWLEQSRTVSHNQDVSVSMLRNKSAFRLSAFYRDIQAIGADRAGGLRLMYDFKSNNLFWLGFNSAVSFVRQDCFSSAAQFGVPTMGLALSGIQPAGQINTQDGWKTDFDDYTNRFRGIGTMYLQINFLPWLKWRTELSFDINNSNRNIWYGMGTQFGSEFENAAAIDVAAMFGYAVQTTLSAERYFSKHHRVGLIAHAQFDGDINKYNNMSGDHFITDVLRSKGFSLRQSAAMPHYSSKEYSSIGIDGNLSYSYDSYAGLNATFRTDKMFRYDDSFTFYPSLSVWVDIREMFFKKNETFSGLALNGGWGKSGYRKYLPYQLSGRAIGNKVIADALAENGIVIDSSSPKDNVANYFDGINRTESDEWNVALSASFFSNRLSLNVGYYSKNTHETFTLYGFGKQRFTDSYIWKSCEKWSLLSTDNNFYNRGFEADIKAVMISNDIIKWTAYLSGTTNNNNIQFYLGEQMESFKAFPSFYGGIGTDLSVKGVSLDLAFDGATGFDIYNVNRMLIDGATGISDEYIEKGDYLRLSKVSVGYAFKFNRDKVKWIRALDLSLTGTNLFTVSKYSGVNPDVNSFGTTAGRYYGLDYGALPLSRSIMLGIKAEF